MNQVSSATIAAIATPPGRGGIGIIRISGSQVQEIARAILRKIPIPRYALHTSFFAEDGTVIDDGIALYFPAPNSFTGEDVLELQGHGGPIILDQLLKQLLKLGLQLARPGEFSERAFLNGKIDLAQAEAIADLIDASSEQAACSALRSLQGEFSRRIQQLVEALIKLRMYVEAAIDFPEEEIDFLADENILRQLKNIFSDLLQVEASAQQGVMLRDGMNVVIAGRPNAGKSSLLNHLSGSDLAIVTDIPGTTRDVLRTHILLDGLPLHIIDTAGLRHSTDPVEQEGIRRAQQEISNADHLLLLIDASHETQHDIPLLCTALAIPAPPAHKLTVVYNKIDLLNEPPQIQQTANGYWQLKISAKTQAGMDLLRSHLKSQLGFTNTTESTFSARRRHLDAIAAAKKHLQQAQIQLTEFRAGELLAEELRLAQNALSEITGKFLPDDLLGKIFSSFCIGK